MADPSSYPPVWIDGELAPAEEALVSVFDRGVTVGEGVFETLRATHGEPFAPRRHLARLRRSAAGLGIEVPYDDADLEHALRAVAGAAGFPRARLRLTVTGGAGPLGTERTGCRPTVFVAAGALTPPEPSTAVAVVPWPRNERCALAGLKTTSYAANTVALAYARRRGAGEAIFANTSGELCEGAGSNVFVVLGGNLVTPPLSSGCLDGVTRELLILATTAIEAPVSMTELAEVEEVLLTSTTREVQAVHRVDGRHLPAPGPVTREAMRAWAALVGEEMGP